MKVDLEVYQSETKRSLKSGNYYTVGDVGINFNGKMVRGELFLPLDTKAGKYSGQLVCMKREGRIEFALGRELAPLAAAAAAAVPAARAA